MKFLCIFSLFILVSGCSSNDYSGPMIVSVSSDGNYAISSDYSKNIILWDIKNKTEKLISTNGNIYSAYFIKNSPYLMWQDLNDFVHVQDVNGKEVLSFHNFPAYGQIMSSDLKDYFASDINWTTFSGYGKNQRQIKKFCAGAVGFVGNFKLLNLSLTNDNKYLLSSGASPDPSPISDGMCSKVNKGDELTANSLFDGLTLWDNKTKRPLHKFDGLMTQTFATFSPDGKYILAGDQEGESSVWEVETGHLLYNVDDLLFGHFEPNLPEGFNFEKVPEQPKGYKSEFPGDHIFSLKFIDLTGDYLRFQTDKHYTILFNINDRRPKKYLYLGKYPEIVTTAFYDRDEAIDTAPAANILVVGKKYTDGIVVYKFDPVKQILKKVWSPNVNNFEIKNWMGYINSFL